MVYLIGLTCWWIGDALLPAAAFAATAGTLWLLLAVVAWPGRSRLRWRGLAVVGALSTVWLAVATHAVWFQFNNPQYAMFRDYVADPIPASVEDLVVDSAAPSMFFRGALLRLRAPCDVRDAILAHALPGSVTRLQAARAAERCERDPTVVARIASKDGGYLRYDPATFAAFDTPEWAFALGALKTGKERDVLAPAPADHDLFVYAERGDWGILACVATVQRGSDAMTLHVRPLWSGRRR